MFKKSIFKLLLIILSMFFVLIGDSSFTQEIPIQAEEKVPIVLDGKELFNVGSIENFTAEERAELINSNLLEEVNGLADLQLQVFVENEQTVIRNNTDDKHILNVTQSDVISGTTIEQQAQVWRNKLQKYVVEGRRQRSTDYILEHLWNTFYLVVFALCFNLFFYFFGKFCINKLAWLLKNPASLVYNLEIPFKIVWNLTIFLLQIGVWIGVLFYTSQVFPLVRTIRYQLYQTLDTNIFNLGATQYSAIDLLLLLVFTIVLWFIIRIFTIFFKQNILRKTGANIALQEVITIILQYILSFLAIIILWQFWGFDVSSLAILVSVLGVGIGFGLQNIANNFISGLIIIIERPIQVGDFIKVGDWQGKVQKIGSRSTVIKTMDKISIIIPNSRFVENDVINWNYGDPISRLKIPIGVAYDSNIKKVRRALLEAVKSHPDVLVTPRPQIWFKEFADSSLNFEVCIWINEPAKQLQIISELNYRIAASLFRHQIEIPFPQRDLNLRSPKLDKAIEIWLKKQGISPNTEVKQDLEEMEITLDETDIFVTNLEDKLTDETIKDLIIQIRGENGIKILDRRYRLNLYERCFIGQELVNWLIANHQYDRKEATELGQILVEKKIIHHVTDEHPFMDRYLFYRFYLDE